MVGDSLYAMGIMPIKTAQDHAGALTEIEALMDAQGNTPEGDRLDVLVTLVEAYEAKHHAIEAPDAIEAILFRMEQMNLGQADLAKLLGSRSRASEFLGRKRRLTIAQANTLHEVWRVPAESLLKPYEIVR